MTLSEIQEELLDEESVKAFDKKISRVFKVVSNLQQSYSARCIEFIIIFLFGSIAIVSVVTLIW